MVPDKTVNRFDVVSQLLAALSKTAGDLLSGPDMAVDARVLQQLQHTQMNITVARHHLHVLAAGARLHDVSVQQTLDRLIDKPFS